MAVGEGNGQAVMCRRNLHDGVGDWREDSRLQQKMFQCCMCNVGGEWVPSSAPLCKPFA